MCPPVLLSCVFLRSERGACRQVARDALVFGTLLEVSPHSSHTKTAHHRLFFFRLFRSGGSATSSPRFTCVANTRTGTKIIITPLREERTSHVHTQEHKTRSVEETQRDSFCPHSNESPLLFFFVRSRVTSLAPPKDKRLFILWVFFVRGGIALLRRRWCGGASLVLSCVRRRRRSIAPLPRQWNTSFHLSLALLLFFLSFV